MKCGSTTSILNQNNKACNGTNEIGQNCHFITLCNSVFHVVCKQPTTTKMHKIFIAQKSYCGYPVLSLATMTSKYYFNFILNRTTSGRELFDRPSCIFIRCTYSYDVSCVILLTTLRSLQLPAAGCRRTHLAL